MNRSICLLAATAILLTLPVRGDYLVESKGSWPGDWPKEMEPLRNQSKTLEGPTRLLLHYAIPFQKREDFESAWPHILKVKSKKAPIVLRRGPSFWLGKEANAGVCIHTPPKGEAPVAGDAVTGGQWEKTIYIELIVDGEIVDLNRLSLPADTPIIDERFKDSATK